MTHDAPQKQTGGIMLAIVASVANGAGAAANITQRQISSSEYDWANNVFHGTLPPMDKIYLTNLTGLNGRYFTIPWRGNIYVNLGSWYADPAHAHLDDVEHPNRYPRPGQVFIHELTHAWQILHSPNPLLYLCTAVITQVKYSLGTNVYNYGPPTSSWGSFNLEAQAAVVDGWFGGVSNPSNPSYTPNRKRTDSEDPSQPDFAGGTSDPYFHYIRDNIRAAKT